MISEEYIRAMYQNKGHSEEEIEKVLQWRRDTHSWKENYYKTHKFCPICGEKAYAPHYVSRFVFIVCENYADGCNKDTNEMECSCGWHGIVDDLKG